MGRWYGSVALAGAALVAVGGLLWPAARALVELSTAADWSAAALTPRRWGLLWRGLWVAGAAGLAAQVVGVGLAAGLLARRTWLARATAWLGLVVVLTPPYIYAYAWSLVFLPQGLFIGVPEALPWPAWVVTGGRAVLCLATWSAPVAAAVLWCGWRAAGRAAYQLARLDATPAQAAGRVLWPALWPWLLLSWGVTTILALTEYSVCHLCLVQTWNTEVLAEAQHQVRPGAALALAWPLVGLVVLLLALLWPLRRVARQALGEFASLEGERWALGGRLPGGRWLMVWGLAAAGLLVLPLVLLVSRLRRLDALVAAWRTYPDEWFDGLLYAGGAAVAAVWLAVALDFGRAWGEQRVHEWPRRAARGAADGVALLALLAAVLPPALVGDALAAAYLHFEPALPLTAVLGYGRLVEMLSSPWPLMSFVGVARYGILAIVAVRLVRPAVAAEVLPAALADGASWATAQWRVVLPRLRGTLVMSGLVVGLLTLGEVAASQMVRPPTVSSLAISLLNAIHFGRDDQIIAMCVYQVLLVAVCVGLLGLVAGRGRAQR